MFSHTPSLILEKRFTICIEIENKDKENLNKEKFEQIFGNLSEKNGRKIMKDKTVKISLESLYIFFYWIRKI